MFTDHFDKTFCLNLPIREDRKTRMDSLFKKHRMDVEFFSGVRGFAVPYLHSLLSQRFSAPGYIGTLISYLNLFDYALERGYEKICVLEDDIMVHKNVNEIADMMIPQLPADTDMAYFSYIPLTEDHQWWKYNILDERYIKGNPLMGIFKAKNLCSMMAFSINRKLMQHLVLSLNKNFEPIDLHIMANIQDKTEFNVYGVNPQLFCSSEGFSDGCNAVIPNLTMRSIDRRASSPENYE
jgi:GR25 family glycosyltransferase involved in LPS biosynthesis